MQQITLAWNGPYTFQELFNNSKLMSTWDVPGVYLWVENLNGKDRLLYVGRCKGGSGSTISKRHLHHYMSYLGGIYPLPERARTSKQRWNLDLRIPGVSNKITQKNEFLKLAEEGFGYANKLSLYFAQLPSTQVEIIERNLIYFLQPEDNISGTKTPPKVEIEIFHENSLWVTSSIKSKNKNIKCV